MQFPRCRNHNWHNCAKDDSLDDLSLIQVEFRRDNERTEEDSAVLSAAM